MYYSIYILKAYQVPIFRTNQIILNMIKTVAY